MDRLELHVRQRRLDERRRALGLVVEEALERAEAVGAALGGRRNEARHSRAACRRSSSASGGTRPALAAAAPRSMSRTSWISRSSRVRKRKAAARCARGRAPAPRRSSRPRATSSSGTPGASSSSKSRRSESEDCVPSICEDSTASLRTYIYRNKAEYWGAAS